MSSVLPVQGGISLSPLTGQPSSALGLQPAGGGPVEVPVCVPIPTPADSGVSYVPVWGLPFVRMSPFAYALVGGFIPDPWATPVWPL